MRWHQLWAAWLGICRPTSFEIKVKRKGWLCLSCAVSNWHQVGHLSPLIQVFPVPLVVVLMIIIVMVAVMMLTMTGMAATVIEGSFVW